MTIEEVMNKLRMYSSSEANNAREAGKREAYEHALYLLEAVTPKETNTVLEPKTITVEGINNTWLTDMPKLSSMVQLDPGVKNLKEKAREYYNEEDVTK